MAAKYNFSGYATKFNIRCSDGRVIMREAFQHQNGITVPLVWQHQHDNPNNVLGHAVLEHRKDGVYAYGVFNDTEAGRQAKTLVEHGDISALSIHANQLKQSGSDVRHGNIREVSLVLAGANPGASIDNISMSHSMDTNNFEAIIYTDSAVLYHGDNDEEDEDMDDVYVLEDGRELPVYDEEGNKIEYVDDDGNVIEFVDEDEDDNDYDDEDYDDEDDEDYDDEDEDYGDDEDGEYTDGDDASHSGIDTNESLVDIFDSMTEQQQLACYTIVQEAINSNELSQGGIDMKRNLFDRNGYKEDNTLSHAEFEGIMENARKIGSLKEAVLQHATTYGIENIDVLFPDAKGDGHQWLERETEWVSGVLSGTGKTPFSRVKSVFADMNFDEARARGYIKAHEKRETYFKASKRVTTPYTVYVKQKLDRDDIIDVTDFDIVAMVRYQLRTLLNEELARAIMFGDGRDPADEYKISETNIRPIWKDDELFTVRVSDCKAVVDSTTADEFIEKVVFSHKEYKGSGNPVMYTTPDLHTRMLWIKDTLGRRIYNSDSELCSALRVSKIVEIPQMEALSRTEAGKTHKLLAIKVNLKDYNCGADKGGQISTFDDFDIDFNQHKYLMETRMSGALTKPYSAIVFETTTP